MKLKISLICIIFMTSINCFAKPSVTYNSSSREIKVTGANEQSAKGFVNMVISPAETDIEEMTDEELISSNDIIYKTVESSTDGEYSATVILPQTLENGKYIISVYGDSYLGKATIGYVKNSLSGTFLSNINAQGSAAAVLEQIKNAKAEIGLDSAYLTSPYEAVISQYIYSKKPSGGYSSEVFLQNYYMAEGISRFIANDITLGNMLMEYCAYTGIDYLIEYEILSDNIKNELANLLSDSFNVSDNFRTVFEDKKSISVLKNSPSFEALRDAFLETASSGSISTYNSLKNQYYKDMVFQEVYRNMATAKSMEDFVKLFNTAVLNAVSASNSSPAGGGGGISSGGGGLAIKLPVNEEISNDNSSFSDISGHWGRDDIEFMKSSGYINGFSDGSFKPDDYITRGEFTKILTSIFNLEPVSGDYFSDVTNDKWYAGIVYAAYQAGLIMGADDGRFYGDSHITRQDAAVIIMRGLKLAPDEGITFADDSEISQYAREAVSTLSKYEILKGYDGNINPVNRITRAESAALLKRALQHLKEGE